MVVASWYHCSVKPISRSNGRTAIAAAAYRSGERLHDKQLDKTYDYTRRRGVETSFIVAPYGAPEWAYNLEHLWNEAQAKDNRVNSRMAREVELALPSSLDATEREALARDFAVHLVERYGVAVSVALHEPGKEGDERNYHAHIMMTTRRIDKNGFGAKTRELDDKITGGPEIEHIREYAATLINEYLEDAGRDERVDHRSFKDRGSNQIPTEHLGVEASAMERRGEESEMGNKNREIEERNRNIDALVNDLAALDAEIERELEQAFLPTDDPEPEIAAPTWEEQKAAAQSPFDAPQAVHPSEQQKPEIAALTWEEQKAAGQSAFETKAAQTFEAVIQERGEIKEFGLGKSWYDRTVVFFENIYYGTMNYLKNSVEKYVSRFLSPAQDRDIELDRDE